MFTIHWNELNFSRCTLAGLKLLVEMCREAEDYEKLAILRDEYIRRGIPMPSIT